MSNNKESRVNNAVKNNSSKKLDNNIGKINNLKKKINNLKSQSKMNNSNLIQNKLQNNKVKNIELQQLPNITQQELTEDLLNEIDVLNEQTSKYKYAAVIVSIIIVLLILIYIYRNRKEESEVKVFLTKQDSQNKYVYDSNLIPLPKNGYDYTINFWIYISDFYENYSKWRHILHKGSNNDGNIEFNNWNNLTQEIQEQSPGIWLHPNKNNIRLAFTVELNKDYCSSNILENTCIEKSYCTWDGLSCNPKKPHAFTNEENTEYENTDKIIIEYVDIENIPVRTMINIGFTLEEKILNIYLNGKLHKVKKFLGVPVFNKENLHFNLKDTYGGYIYNFRYLSQSISAQKMDNYYNKIPNIDKFSKKYRMKKYASMFMFGELLKTLFI
jgi:hypothetical protein